MDFVIEGDDSLNAKHENKHLKQTQVKCISSIRASILE